MGATSVPRQYRTKLTPEQRAERARNAGRAAHSNEVHVRAVIKAEVDKAPPLTPEQKARLRAIFASGTQERAA
jgi:hypothetical protein